MTNTGDCGCALLCKVCSAVALHSGTISVGPHDSSIFVREDKYTKHKLHHLQHTSHRFGWIRELFLHFYGSVGEDEISGAHSVKAAKK